MKRFQSTAAFCAVVITAPAFAAPPLFDSAWRAFDVADYPEFAPIEVIGVDLDDDGDLDALVAREFWWSPGLAVLRNNGDGSFAEEELYHLSNQMDVGGMDAADIDMDGDIDAITTIAGNAGTDFRFALWRNNGDGTFGAPTLFETGDGPTGVVIADVTGDGFPDVITADNGYVAGPNDTISINEHNGRTGAQAGFLPYRTVTVGDNCQRVDAGDIDDDGDIDLCVGRGAMQGGASGVHVLRNDGTGHFTEILEVEALPGAYRNSYAVQFVDTDNDADLDLVASGATNGSPSFGKIVIRRNDGAGNFGAPEIHNLADWSFTPWDVDSADLNGDGWVDIFATTPSGRAIDGFNVLFNDGFGGFGGAQYYHAAKWTYDADAFDVDGDGFPDMVTAANDSSVITVHPNDGEGGFPDLPKTTIGFLVRDLVEGDIDQDGQVDLVAGGDADVHLLRNDGTGAFPTAERFDTPFSPGDILLADMNGDECLDIVIRAYNFAVALSDCEGGFLPAVVTQVGSSQSGEVGAFDLDNDGDLDIVCTDPGPASRVYLFRNNGNGTSFTFMNIIADNDGLPFGIAGGDLNHDGNVDLLFNNALGITVYLGNGDFTVSEPFPTSEYGYPFILHDLNADGELDLALKMPEPSFGTTEVGTMLGFGDGSFAFANTYPGPNGREGAFRVTSDVDVADVTGDGIPDVVFTNNAPNDISVFPGVGDGTLLPQDRYGAGYSAHDSAIADFNEDGRADVGVAIGLAPSGLTSALVVLYGHDPGPMGETAEIIDVTMITGTILGGGGAELINSDDAYLRTRSGFGATLIDLHHMETAVTAMTTLGSPARLDLTIESHIDQPSGQAQIRLRNYTTGQRTLIGTYAIGSTDSVRAFENIDAAAHVDPGTGTIEASIKHIVFVPFLAFTFESFVDQVEVRVQ